MDPLDEENVIPDDEDEHEQLWDGWWSTLGLGERRQDTSEPTD